MCTKGVKTTCPLTAKKDGNVVKKPSLTFRSSNIKVATVGKTTGVVKGIGVGKCKITCTWTDKNRVTKAEISVEVVKKVADFEKPFDYISHRGNIDNYPENTVEAFIDAIDRGCIGIECDVWYTNSGDLLMCHDNNLQRLCGVNRSIRSLTKDTRFNYPLLSPDNQTYYIPTLDEVMEAMYEYDAIVYLHLKGDTSFPRQGLDKIYECIKKHKMTKSTVVFCSSRDPLKYLKKYDLTLGTILKDNAELASNLKWCKNNSVDHIFFPKTGSITERSMNLVKQYNVKVGIYWLTNRSDILFAMDHGMDFGLITHDLVAP